MEFLFETYVLGVLNKSGLYAVYKMSDGKYFCKMIVWHENHGITHGDFEMWKEHSKIMTTIGSTQIAECIYEDLANWNQLSETTKDKLRATFKTKK